MKAFAQSSIMPTLRYRDAHAAIKFLCEVFGFEKHAVFEDENGSVAHAELVLGGGMVMLGSFVEGSLHDRWVQPPASRDAVTTQGIYVIVDDCKAHYARAKKAGVEILMELEDKDYGGAGYSCRDPEGHVWSFGGFNPWVPEVPGPK
jgi:uncharacterized glyoxalase superfamily protein PhnB